MELQFQNYEARGDGYYENGKRISNFLLYPEALEQNLATGQTIYRIRLVINGGKEKTVNISAGEVNSGGWRKKISPIIWTENPAEFNQNFRRALSAAEDHFPRTEIITARTGFQKVDGKWIFAFSNGAITENGVCETIRAEVTDCYYFGTCDWQDMKDATAFLELIRRQSDTLYPIFAVNLLAAVRNLFRNMGIDLSLSLWLEGDSGVGKTTLAKTVGTFVEPEPFDEDGKLVWNERSVLSATEKVACAVRTLVESDGHALIADDFKDEDSQRQREKTRAILDIIVRSVYRGRVTERKSQNTEEADTVVGTCAIFTGEYRRTTESQSARMIIVDVGDFIQEPEKKRILTELQQHLEWQADLVGGFILWLIRQANETGSREVWREKMRDLRNKPWEHESRSNGQRLKDTRDRLLFVTDVFGNYLTATFPDARKEIQAFLEAARRGVEHAVRYTMENFGGVGNIVLNLTRDVLSRLIKEGRIREARMENQWGKLEEEQFMFAEEIDKPMKYNALLVRNVQKSLDAADLCGISTHEEAALVILREDFTQMLEQQVKKFVEEKRLTEEEGRRISLSVLAKQQIILTWPRWDSGARYSKPYPRLRLWEVPCWDRYNGGEYTSHCGEMWNEEAICINLKHDLFQNLLDESFPEEDIPAVLEPQQRKESRKVRKAFISGRRVFQKKSCK